MGKVHTSIEPELQSWLEKQKLFFVATAPLARDGHVNCSPKGSDTFRLLGESEVAYLDLTGSGIETVAHLQENERIVIMFCALEGPPKIVRLHGRGSVVYPGQPDFEKLLAHFPAYPGVRSIVRVALTRVTDSCGFSIPQFQYVGERETLDQWAVRKGPDGVAKYQREKNTQSIDGCPGYRGA